MSIDPVRILETLFDDLPDNCFDVPGLGPMFDRPLVAVAAADDPWWARLKEHIGATYWTPQEALALSDPQAEAKSVISWSLPITAPAREGNRTETEMPSRPWAYVRTFGNDMLTRMAHAMEEHLRQLGWTAIATGLTAENKIQELPTVGLAARWSERHVAFVAGLGTFGISGGLITRAGKAQRLASVVTNAEIPPTVRPYGDDPFAWCLRTALGTCGKCIERCPAASVGGSHNSRDKKACQVHSYGTVKKKGPELFGWDGAYGCGLCQTGVPCEDRNPLEAAPPE